MDPGSLVKEIFDLVNIPLYGVRGVVSGERLLVTALREGAVNAYIYDEGRLVKLNKAPISGVVQPPRDSDRIIIYRDVSRGREQMDLLVVNLDKPGVEERLTEEWKPARLVSAVDKGEVLYTVAVTQTGVALYKVVPGGSVEKIADIPGMGFIVDVGEEFGVGMMFHPSGRLNLLLVDLATGQSRVEELGGSVNAVAVLPNGRVAVGLERADHATLLEYDPKTGKAEPLGLPHRDLEEEKPAAFTFLRAEEDGSLVAVTRKNGRGRVFVDGRALQGPPGIYGPAYKWKNGVAVIHSSLSIPYRVIWLGEDGWRPVLEPEVPEGVREAIGASGFHLVESFDGERVPVFTLESRRAGKPGPTVVLVHGGPWAETFDGWDIFASALALAGFNVVMPNYRGSTGYGEEWRSKIIGDPCGAELEDIVASAEWAKKTGLASWLVVMGYSYGGYATMCALTRKPGVFRAGVAGASVVDWEEMYELSDPLFRYFIELLFGGQDREKWRERSPIHYVDNLQEPLCIIHPQNDSRTPLKPVLRFMEKALEKGKTYEAHIAPDMGHAVNTVDDAIKLLLPAILFLDRIRRTTK